MTKYLTAVRFKALPLALSLVLATATGQSALAADQLNPANFVRAILRARKAGK